MLLGSRGNEDSAVVGDIIGRVEDDDDDGHTTIIVANDMLLGNNNNNLPVINRSHRTTRQGKKSGISSPYRIQAHDYN